MPFEATLLVLEVQTVAKFHLAIIQIHKLVISNIFISSGSKIPNSNISIQHALWGNAFVFLSDGLYCCGKNKPWDNADIFCISQNLRLFVENHDCTEMQALL